MKRSFTTIALLLMAAIALAAPKTYVVSSPDGRLSAAVEVGERISYSVSDAGTLMIAPSEISMTLADGTVYGGASKVQKVVRRSVSREVTPVVYKKSSVQDRFEEMTLRFKTFDLVFRAYDEGVAYRFVSKSRTPFRVASEKAEFAFPSDWNAYIPYSNASDTSTLDSQLSCSFENTYSIQALSSWDKGRLAFMPVLVEADGGRKVCITEADLRHYPGMFLYNPAGGTSLEGYLAKHPDEIVQGGHNMLQGLVQTRKDYLAEAQPGAQFPWRVIIVSEEDKDLTDSDIVYNLASEADSSVDWSWVRPGKVAWDWWNDWNISGVDFVSGINNDTYKYYIDFASANGIEYVILDEGWSVNLAADLTKVVPEIDLRMLSEYAASRNVGLILWAGYLAFNKDIEGLCKLYSEMGFKGFKIDFMDRDDQMIVDFYEEVCATAAKYHMMVDFHGAYKPTGLHRTYPNLINYEGVHGLEQVKWGTDIDQVTYDVTIPFIRMVAGQFDYTQGAMRNATRSNYFACNDEPMSQGTRCHQLAEYVVFESPLNMLCDTPTAYMAEPVCTEFIAGIPTVWDETVAIDGKVGEFAAIARRKGDTWYVGVLGNWNPQRFTLDLGFLGDGEFDAVVYQDGANAHRKASDFAVKSFHLDSACRSLEARLSSGGGWVAKIVPSKD